MDKIFTYVIKEEIIRNVLRTHNNVLVIGWSGTGKTVSTLKAAKGQGEVYYFSVTGPDKEFPLAMHNDEAKVLADISDLEALSTETSILIIDGLNKAGAPLLGLIGNIMSGRPRPGKIILISTTLMDAGAFLDNIEAVVRLKKETAEMTFSSLCGQVGLQ